MATITGERSGLQEASDLGNYLELKCCAMPAFRDEPRLGIGYFASTAINGELPMRVNESPSLGI